MSLCRFVFALAWLGSALGTGVFEVQLTSVENVGGRLADGRCCNGGPLTSSNDSTSCPGICETAVRVCLMPYRQSTEVQPPKPDRKLDRKLHCSYGEAFSEHTLGTNSFRSEEIVAVPFTYTWPGSTTLVVQLLHRHREDERQELIDEFEQILELNATASGEWLEFTSRPDNRSLINPPIGFGLRMRIRCDSTYFGPLCSVVCVATDGPRGHYDCDPVTGQRICLPGWRGLITGCDKPICATGCHGGCDRPGECSKCPFGWTGPKCDQCQPYPGCVHGYCTKPHECLCYERWGGFQCDMDLDYCYHKSPCRNGATCIPFQQNNYTCVCAAGFVGRDCEIEQNPCWSNPCQNFGTCAVTSKTEYKCVCDRLHTGAHCEHLLAGHSDADPCLVEDRVYEHGHSWTMPNCRRCRCVDGFANCSKAACQTENCLMGSNPCPHGQQCSAIAPDPYTCLKPPCSARAFGQCLPFELDVKQATTRRNLCLEPKSEYCSRFELTLNISAVPIGTYINHICYRIMIFLIEKDFKEYYAFCSLNPNSSAKLIVELVSLKDRWQVTSLTDILKESLRENRAAFGPLIANTVVDATDSANRPFDEIGPETWQKAANRVVVAVIVVVVVIVCSLLATVCLLCRRMRAPNIRKLTNSRNLNSNLVECPLTPTSPKQQALQMTLPTQWNNWGEYGKQCNLWKACQQPQPVRDDQFVQKQLQWLSKKPTMVVAAQPTSTASADVGSTTTSSEKPSKIVVMEASV